MQTTLAPEFAGTADGVAAEAILRACVHCGFCTATCPTYQLLGDELDGPRGRIYQIKRVLEGEAPTRETQTHLDRCLTCRACETTCPSGVEYGRLVEIGRRVVDAKVERPLAERSARWLLREGMTSRAFAPALNAGRSLRPLLPAVLKDKVTPASPPEAHRWPKREHPRKVLLLLGCVQPALRPNVSSATARVLDACGIQVVVAEEAGCCGAIRAHLGDHDGALADMRRNVDAWWPKFVQDGSGHPAAPGDAGALSDAPARHAVDAIVADASGCSAMLKEMAHALRDDPAYAERAALLTTRVRDLSELLPALVPTLRERLGDVPPDADAPLAYHPPCTLQHAQKLRGGVESALLELGWSVALPAESHLCCGSAGTYSVLQPRLAKALRGRKLAHLEAIAPQGPQAIVSANIGCIEHLRTGTARPVMHWIEWLDRALEKAGSAARATEHEF